MKPARMIGPMNKNSNIGWASVRQFIATFKADTVDFKCFVEVHFDPSLLKRTGVPFIVLLLAVTQEILWHALKTVMSGMFGFNCGSFV